MSYDQEKAINEAMVANDNTWHLMLCRATGCLHNQGEAPLCTFDMGLEFDEKGFCIHYTPKQ